MKKIQILFILWGILFLYRPMLYGGFSTNELEPEPNWGVHYCSISCGDYDNDGNLDLVIAGDDGAGYRLRLYKNLGNGAFNTNEIPVEPGWGVRICSIAGGDYDNDGDLDLAVAGEDGSGYRLRIYKNFGNGTFDGNEVYPEPNWGVRYCSLAWGDFDNDGDLDLAIAGDDGSTNVFRVYRNNGNGTFDTNEIQPEPGWGVGNFSALAWGDYDNDGDLDIAIAGDDGTDYRFRVYKNNGNGTFDTNEIEPQPGWGIDECDLAWGDYDNDGDLDIAIAGYSGWVRLRVYTNLGNGTFGGYTEPDPGWGATLSCLAWGDYDNDGNIDLAISGTDGGAGGKFRIYRNNGNGTFDPSEIQPEPGWGVRLGSIVWGDYDNDGDLDVAIAGYDNAGIRRFRVYTNLENTTNHPPPSPQGMQSLKVDGKWRFQWFASSDDHTTTKAIRYHVAIGTNVTGNYDYTSEMIHYPRGGATMGNVCVVTGAYYQSNISTNRTVYWKVCAIDSSYKVSPYCAEQIASKLEMLQGINAKESGVYPNCLDISRNEKCRIIIMETGYAEIRIYNMANMLVKKFPKRYFESGQYEIWDGLEEGSNKKVGAGVYLVVIEGDNVNKTSKIIIKK
ncbi:MAG: T9SS type A sorting domain-containing protein [Spirochaetes bacterium]|nr:T9SS type A sorting domain-containing protein [Spirochaetota bacterium]